MKHFYKKSLKNTPNKSREFILYFAEPKKKRLYISLRNEGKLMLQMDLKFLKPCSATDIY